MIEVSAKSVEETSAFAAKLARGLAEAWQADPGLSLFVGLSGPLGAGKTELVRGLVAGLDPAWARHVCSPTYAIVQRYETVPPVTHLDLYRLQGLEGLEAIGYRDLYYAPGITVVEWVEAVPAAVPRDWLEIALAVEAADVRVMAARPHGEPYDRIVRGVRG